MKITIDTTNKTIKVEDQVNFCDLNKELKKLLGDAVKEYALLPTETIYNSYPVLVPQFQPSPIWAIDRQPYHPLPYITCNATNT